MRQFSLIRKTLFIGICLFIIIVIRTSVCFAQPPKSCIFSQGTSALSFGNLDPFSTANATSTVTLTISCPPKTTWFLTEGNGLYYDGTTKRMRNQTVFTEYLPYTVTFTPTTADEKVKTITGSGIILNSSYINAYVGTYLDSVTLTIMP